MSSGVASGGMHPRSQASGGTHPRAQASRGMHTRAEAQEYFLTQGAGCPSYATAFELTSFKFVVLFF